jgi:hypothetical protein
MNVNDLVSLKARLHGSPGLINAVESTKVNRVNSSFQRKWSTGLTGEQVGDGQLSFNVVDSLWVTHHRLPCKQASHDLFPSVERVVLGACLVLLIWLLNFVNCPKHVEQTIRSAIKIHLLHLVGILFPHILKSSLLYISTFVIISQPPKNKTWKSVFYKHVICADYVTSLINLCKL